MVRFLVNLLMIPGVLLTQFAAVPHAHASGAHGSSHEEQPHFHFHLRFSLGDPTAVVETRACSGSGCSTSIVADPSPLTDHDADAVYTETATASPERHKQFVAELLALARPLGFAPAFDLDRAPAQRPHAEPVRLPAPCPLYVRYLALTI